MDDLDKILIGAALEVQKFKMLIKLVEILDAL